MSEQNICRFVPREINDHSIHTVHFVLETEEQLYTGLRLKSLYTVYLVTQGTGNLHTQGQILPLEEGDVFFTFPAVPFAIESVTDFQYMYISFWVHAETASWKSWAFRQSPRFIPIAAS